MSTKNNSDTKYYGRDLVTWCNVCNMSAKKYSDSEYYGRDLVTWFNICNMSAKNNSDSEYCGRSCNIWSATTIVNPRKNFKFAIYIPQLIFEFLNFKFYILQLIFGNVDETILNDAKLQSGPKRAYRDQNRWILYQRRARNTTAFKHIKESSSRPLTKLSYSNLHRRVDV